MSGAEAERARGGAAGTGLRMEQGGPWVSVQDLGRPGWQRFGVPESGAMDPVSLRIANRLLGNAPGAAGLEVSAPGLTVQPEGATLSVAVAGPSLQVWLDGAPAAANRSFRLEPGRTLRLRPGPEAAFAYLAVAGGIDAPPVFGSRSFHARSGSGGLGGAPLAAGALLPARPAAPPELELAAPMPQGAAPVAVIDGPQHAHLSAGGWERFLSTPWRVDPRSDRMGIRLDGPALEHSERGFNIVSDGIALGSVQLPGNGLPIVLAADRQTTGGYPKVGVIARADMVRFVQRPAGSTVTFRRCTVAEAVAALAGLERWVAAAPLRPVRAMLDSQRLLSENLIDGVYLA